MPGLHQYEEAQRLIAQCEWEPLKRGKVVNHRNVQWLTTNPHPTRPAHTCGYDQGQVGWKLHLVMATPAQHKRFTRGPAALCGLRPVHGWGLDMFISDLCTRCLRQAIKRKLTLPESPR